MDQPADVAGAEQKLLAVEASGSQSRLGDAVRQVLTELRGAPPTAIVLLSDGQTTEGEPLSKASELAEQKGVPLFAIGLGSAEPARDIELTELLVDDVVFVDDAVRFQAKLSARGFAGEKAVVRLKELEPGLERPGFRARRSSRRKSSCRPTASPSGSSWSTIPRRPASAPSSSKSTSFPASSRPTTTGSSASSRSARRSCGCCIVDSEPRYEFRYLKNYLERDETIDLNVVLLSSDPKYSEQDRSAIPTFPAAKDDLFAYDVVIFGDADISYMSQSQLQNLVEFVTEKGGGVLFVAGDLFNPLAYHGTPLELLLPIELSDARNPTAVGTTVTVVPAPS